MQRSRSRAQSWAVPDSELRNDAQNAISLVMSIPESERLGRYRGWERKSRQPRGTEFYNYAKVYGALIRLADALWASWPPQREERDDLHR